MKELINLLRHKSSGQEFDPRYVLIRTGGGLTKRLSQIAAATLALATLTSYFFYQTKGLENDFIRDFKISFDYEQVDQCSPSYIGENNESYIVYKNFCNLTDQKSFATYLQSLNHFLENNKNSPIISFRPFSNFHGYFLLGEKRTNEANIVLAIFEKNADSEFMRVQPLINFLTQDCSIHSEYIKKALDILPNLHYPLMKATLLSKVIECRMIDGSKNFEFIRPYLATLPLKLAPTYMYPDVLDLYIEDKLGAYSKFFVPFFNRESKVELRKYEEAIYYDFLSQFFYLLQDYSNSKIYLSKAIHSNTNSFKIIPFVINDTIFLTRMGKLLLKLGETKQLGKVVEELKEKSKIYDSLPKSRYPDVSLAQLLLENGYPDIAYNYLDYLVANNHLESELVKKWKEEVKNQNDFNMEFDLYRARNEKFLEDKIFKNEIDQIILFKEKKVKKPNLF